MAIKIAGRRVGISVKSVLLVIVLEGVAPLERQLGRESNLVARCR